MIAHSNPHLSRPGGFIFIVILNMREIQIDRPIRLNNKRLEIASNMKKIISISAIKR